jgi:pimeloyl-ACP methyl ester carboxylesterase
VLASRTSRPLAAGDWAPWQLAAGALVPHLVVAIAPVSDLVEACRTRLSDEGDAVQKYLGGDPLSDSDAELAASRASPITACLPAAVPTLVASGGRDTDVPAEIALRYGAVAAGSEASAEPGPAVIQMALDDADHYSVFDGTSAPFVAIVERAEGLLDAIR